MSGATPAIQVERVTQAFGPPGSARRILALEEASIDVARGELVCLIGPSGCGKSSLLNVMGGLAAPSSGKVWIDGELVRGPSPRKVAYVFQENALFPWRTVIENLKLGMEFGRIPKGERHERATRALEAVGLSEFAGYYPGQLSGGMKQRAQLARALALETEILLMDEPFAALDEQTRMVLGEDLSVLLARTGKTIVFVTHSLMEAVFLADRVAVFSARPGRIKHILSVEEGHPRSPAFMTSAKLSALRNQLYEILHDEIRKAMNLRGPESASQAGKGEER
ncbi:MAG TPA: ABC transporter ATP-binding protein [Patescibacteria group bacterium]|nr:ABC transporter ATP-binding protein [Patescibacteria group bacterium]